MRSICGGVHLHDFHCDNSIVTAYERRDFMRLLPEQPSVNMAIDSGGNRRVEAIEVEAHTELAMATTRNCDRLHGRCVNTSLPNFIWRNDAAAQSLHDRAFSLVDVARCEIDGALWIAQPAFYHCSKRGDINSMQSREHHPVEIS